MNDLYIRIALEMKHQKITQSDLSKRLDCNAQNLVKTLKNGTIRIDKLKRITDLLGLELKEVINLYK